MRTAVGAMYASGCTLGRFPPSSNSTGLYNPSFVTLFSKLVMTRG